MSAVSIVVGNPGRLWTIHSADTHRVVAQFRGSQSDAWAAFQHAMRAYPGERLCLITDRVR